MANYDNLISSIKAAIKPNGTQAITGQVLQDAMLEMVSQLGKNYAFGGVATTSTNPGTPSTNTLYIANEAGAYSNMGGVVLKTSELAVIIWDGKTWSKQTVLEDYVNKTQLDDAVGELSDVVNQNLARIGLCEQQIAEVNNALNGHSGSIEYLTSEIARLSKNYAFGGLVKPSTNPGTPEVNTFYLATEAGTYKSMGGVVLDVDEVAMLSWDGAKWTKETIGVVNESAINGGTYDISLFGKEAGAYNIEGFIRWESSGFYRTNPIELRHGDEVSITTVSTVNVSVFSEVNEAGDYVGTLMNGVNSGSTTFTYKADRDIRLVVSFVQQVGHIRRAGLASRVNRMHDLVARNISPMSNFGKNNGFYKIDGSFGSETGIYHTDPIHLNATDIVSVTTTSTSLMSVISKVTEEGSYISTLIQGDISNSSPFEYEATEECYVVVSFINQEGYVEYRDIRSALNRVASADYRRAKILAIGDSLTAAGTWQIEVGKIINADVRTHALGGIGIVSMVDGIDTFPALSPSDVEDVDIVCLFGAFNAYRTAVENLGVTTDMYPDQPTFIGQLNYALKRIYECAKEVGNDDLRVVLISPYNFGGNVYVTETGITAGVKMLEGFAKASLRHSAQLIDLLHNGQIAEHNWDVYCAGAGTKNTTYLPFDPSTPYGTASIWPNKELPTSSHGGIALVNGMLALVASDNSFGYTYSEWNNGSWSHGIEPWSGTKYPPYAYLWRDYIHLNSLGHKRIAKYIASQLKPIK